MVDAKRLKTTTNEPKKPKHSKIFQPFRAIGYVTNDVPYVINQLGQDYFLTTCVGTSFQTYNVSHLFEPFFFFYSRCNNFLLVGTYEPFVCGPTYPQANNSNGNQQQS
jgi:hypothetical protein